VFWGTTTKNVDLSLSLDDLAVATNRLDRCSNFHDSLLQKNRPVTQRIFCKLSNMLSAFPPLSINGVHEDHCQSDYFFDSPYSGNQTPKFRTPDSTCFAGLYNTSRESSPAVVTVRPPKTNRKPKESPQSRENNATDTFRLHLKRPVGRSAPVSPPKGACGLPPQEFER
jgi:hypothetical protein